MKKILILTDSLGLPRESPEITEYEDTWVSIFDEHFTSFKIHQFSMGGATSSDIYWEVQYLKMYRPDIVILQIGIVDCTPRALKKYENAILNKFLFTRKVILPLIHKYRSKIRKCRSITYVKREDFKTFLKNIVSTFSENTDFYALGILPAVRDIESTTPGITRNIFDYNIILQEVFKENYISTDEIKEDGIMSDNIHLSKEGHIFIFNKLREAINNVE